MGIDVSEQIEQGGSRRASSAPKVYKGKNGFTTARFRNSLVDKLDLLAEGANRALRPAARAGALVFYGEMQIRVPVDDGILKDSLYHFHDDKRSHTGRQVYLVGPNKGRAPHWHLAEFGHWQPYTVVKLEDGTYFTMKDKPLATPQWIPAVPYIRPTFDARSTDAVDAMRRRYAEALRETRTGWR